MEKIKIFLASSNTLLTYREQIQLKISQRNKLLTEKSIYLELVKWEDLTARVDQSRSQNAYNVQIKTSEMFILLASDKVGEYTEEEFDIAYDAFKRKNKPYIYIYFEEIETQKDKSFTDFQNKIESLNHFYSPFTNFDNLWTQINHEIDKVLHELDSEVSIEKESGKVHKQIGNIPLNPNVYLGREGVLENIFESFFDDHKTVLLLNGNGGIGKTTTASAYYHKYQDQYSHLIWTISETGIDDAILSLIVELNIKVNNNLNKSEQVNMVLKKLSSLDTPSLMVIDNADKLEDLENNYQFLLSIPKIHILITSRITEFEFFEKYKIGTLSNEYAKTLFSKYYSKFDEESELDLLNNILTAVNYNTLAIELLAKNLNQLNKLKKNYGLEELLADLQTKGILGLRKTKDVKINYQNLKPTKPDDVVKAMYSLTNLNEEEKSILSVFSVLPNLNIEFEDLEEFIEFEDLDEKLLRLFEKSWIEYDEDNASFKMNPITASVVREENQERLYEDNKVLIELLNQNSKFTTLTFIVFEKDIEIVHKTVVFIELLLTYIPNIEIPILNLYLSLIVYKKDFYSRIQALKWSRIFNEKAQKLAQEHPKDEDAILLWIQSIYWLSNNNEATNLLKFIENKEDETINKNHPENDKIKYQLSSIYMGTRRHFALLGDTENSILYLKKCKKNLTELINKNSDNYTYNIILAWTNISLGLEFKSQEKFDKALEFQQNAFKSLKELNQEKIQNEPVNPFIHAYESIGHTYFQLGDFNLAIDNFQKECEILVKLDKGNFSISKYLGNTYLMIGRSYYYLNDSDEAIKFLNLSLEIFEKLLEKLPNLLEIKQSYIQTNRYLGKSNLHLLNSPEIALNYLNNCLAIYEEKDSKLNTYIAGVKIDLGIYYSTQNDYDKCVKHLLKGIKIIENSELKTNSKFLQQCNHCILHYELSHVYTKLEDKKNVEKYLTEAYLQAKDLIKNSPQRFMSKEIHKKVTKLVKSLDLKLSSNE